MKYTVTFVQGLRMRCPVCGKFVTPYLKMINTLSANSEAGTEEIQIICSDRHPETILRRFDLKDTEVKDGH